MTYLIFPQLLVFSSIAPLIIRIILSLVFIHFGRNRMKYPLSSTSKLISLVEIILGLLILIGLFTQLAAILISIIMLVQIVSKIKNRRFLTDGINYYLILFAMALSLIFSGSGTLAFDMI